MVRKFSYKEYYIDGRTKILNDVINDNSNMYIFYENIVYNYNNNIKLKQARYNDAINIILNDRKELYNQFYNLFLMREIRKYFKQKQKLKNIIEKINYFDKDNKLCYDIRSIIINFLM